MAASREDLENAYIDDLLGPSGQDMDLELFPEPSFFAPVVGSVSTFPGIEGNVSSDAVSSTIAYSASSVLSGGGGDGGSSQGTPVSAEDSGPWMGATSGMANWDTGNSGQDPKPDEVAPHDSGNDSIGFDSGAWEDWRQTIDEIMSRSASPVGEKEGIQSEEGRVRETGEKTKREEDEDRDVPLKKRRKVRYDLDDPGMPAYHKKRLLRQRKARKRRSDLAKRGRMMEAKKEMEKIMRGERPKGDNFNCPHCGEIVVAFKKEEDGEKMEGKIGT